MPGPGSIAVPKPEPRVIAKRQKRLDLAQEERTCRAAVRWRDKGRCVVPHCRAISRHLHHIVYRSHGGQWQTQNICSLCPAHHALVHAGKIQISGNADEELTFTGEKQYLSFKL